MKRKRKEKRDKTLLKGEEEKLTALARSLCFFFFSAFTFLFSLFFLEKKEVGPLPLPLGNARRLLSPTPFFASLPSAPGSAFLSSLASSRSLLLRFKCVFVSIINENKGKASKFLLQEKIVPPKSPPFFFFFFFLFLFLGFFPHFFTLISLLFSPPSFLPPSRLNRECATASSPTSTASSEEEPIR